MPRRECQGPGHQDHADVKGDQPGGFEQEETWDTRMLPPKTTMPRTVPAIGSAPRQALALLVGDLHVAVDVDDLLGAQPLGEASGPPND